jgi:predicted nucleic acid-binding protein
VGTLGWYLDASVIVALFRPEPFSDRADQFIRTHTTVIASDFTVAEAASAIARCVRLREMTMDQARIVLASLDAWLARSAQQIEITSADIAAATAFLRRLDLPLRTPDAVHIAATQRLGRRLSRSTGKWQRMHVHSALLSKNPESNDQRCPHGRIGCPSLDQLGPDFLWTDD